MVGDRGSEWWIRKKTLIWGHGRENKSILIEEGWGQVSQAYAT